MPADEIDVYLAGLDGAHRSSLEALRSSILSVVPDADQGISYGCPAFRVQGKLVAGFAAHTKHLNYLPHSGTVVGELGDSLVGYETTKGSVKFVPGTALPDDLVRILVEARLRELGIA